MIHTRRTKKEMLADIEKPIKASKIVANNTVGIDYEDGTTAIRLHLTDVVTFKKDRIMLDSGGWRTTTTKQRINEFSPFHLTQEEGIWYVNGYYFYDGIKLDYEGKLLSENKEPDKSYIRKTKKMINDFVRLIYEDNLPVPDSGDCWFCLMEIQDGDTLGDATENTDHLWSHIEEGYVPGSLLVNAMREKGYTDYQIKMHYSMGIVDTFRRAVRKYMQKRLITNYATS